MAGKNLSSHMSLHVSEWRFPAWCLQSPWIYSRGSGQQIEGNGYSPLFFKGEGQWALTGFVYSVSSLDLPFAIPLLFYHLLLFVIVIYFSGSI